MRLRIPLLLSLCSLSLLATGLARAQSADDFFHGGAQSYITNNAANARAEVDAGLKLYPDDTKLKKLDELLKQQSQQQDQNQQQQNQQQQNQQNQKQQDQKNQQSQQNKDQQQQNKGDQQKQDANKQDQKNQQQKNQDAKDQQGKSADEKKDEQQEQASAAEAKPMTPDEAKRLLDAQKGDEKVLMMSPPGNDKAENPDHPHKDW